MIIAVWRDEPFYSGHPGKLATTSARVCIFSNWARETPGPTSVIFFSWLFRLAVLVSSCQPFPRAVNVARGRSGATLLGSERMHTPTGRGHCIGTRILDKDWACNSSSTKSSQRLGINLDLNELTHPRQVWAPLSPPFHSFWCHTKIVSFSWTEYSPRVLDYIKCPLSCAPANKGSCGASAPEAIGRMDAEGNTSAPAQHILCVYMMLPPAIAVQGIQTHSHSWCTEEKNVSTAPTELQVTRCFTMGAHSSTLRTTKWTLQWMGMTGNSVKRSNVYTLAHFPSMKCSWQ